MKRNTKAAFAVMIGALCIVTAVLTSCSGNTSEEQRARRWLDRAREMYARDSYDEALAAIASLRADCPGAVDERREALGLYKEIDLARTEKDIARTDSLLGVATDIYEKMRDEAEKCKAQGTATAEQLTATTRARMQRDSLQAAFNFLCAKAKHIRRQSDAQ